VSGARGLGPLVCAVAFAAGVKLGRTGAHRRALFRNLVTALLEQRPRDSLDVIQSSAPRGREPVLEFPEGGADIVPPGRIHPHGPQHPLEDQLDDLLALPDYVVVRPGLQEGL